MSIPAAVAELNKEIAQLDKKKERLVGLRDALLKEDTEAVNSTSVPVPAKRGPAAKKSTTAKKSAAVKKAAPAKKSVVVKKAAPAKKRTLSPEGRKRIADAARARWAKNKPAATE